MSDPNWDNHVVACRLHATSSPHFKLAICIIHLSLSTTSPMTRKISVLNSLEDVYALLLSDLDFFCRPETGSASDL